MFLMVPLTCHPVLVSAREHIQEACSHLDMFAVMIHDGHAYVVMYRQVNYTSALDLASQMTFHGLSGHLAAVTSASELNFLRWTMNAQNAWIALTKDNSENIWRHTAGPEAGLAATPANFLFWLPDEPKDTKQFCTTFLYGGYSATNCSYLANYLVEFECTVATFPGRCNSKHVSHSFQRPNSYLFFVRLL